MKYLFAFIGTLGFLLLSYGQDSVAISTPVVPTDTIDAYLDFAESFTNFDEGGNWESEGLSQLQKAYQITIDQNDTLRRMRALDLFFWYVVKQRNRKKRSEYQAEKSELARYFGYNVSNLERQMKKNPDAFQHLIFQELWILPDTLGNWTLDSVRQPSRISQFKPNSVKWVDQLVDIPALWMKIRLKTDSDKREIHTFQVGTSSRTWDKIEVYIPDGQGGFEQRITGQAYLESEKDIEHRNSFFQVPMSPHQDSYIFLRMEGIKPSKIPQAIQLVHVDYEQMLKDRTFRHHLNGIFQGMVLIQLFYFLLLFFTTKDPTYGYYSLYILGLSIFILTVNYVGETIPSEAVNRPVVFTLAVWLSTVGMLRFSMVYFKTEKKLRGWHKTVTDYLKVFSLVTVVAIFPFIFSDFFFAKFGEIGGGLFMALPIVLLSFLVFAGLMLILIWGIQAYKSGYAPAKSYLIALIFLIVGMVLPIVLLVTGALLKYSTFLDADTLTSVLQGGIALQLCFFALGVGNQRNQLEAERRNALQENLEYQQKINTAARRFVPYEFLKTLGHDSILSVNLGDQVEKEVTVFFSDIRDYTTFSEQMTPKENFSFLNSYLGRVGPVIKANGGFVNQYYGDGIMALFLGGEEVKMAPTDSIEAAIDMLEKLKEYNQERDQKGRPFVKIGIGIHSGPLMMGILGDGKRMDAGVVSDSVNTTARLEGLTKIFGASILVSEVTFNGLKDPSKYNYRDLGKVLVKGRQEPIRIFDFFDGDLAEIRELKRTTLNDFQQAMNHYLNRKFKEAIDSFAAVLHENPQDIAAQLYLQKAQEYFKNGVDESWNGVEIILAK